MKLERIEQFIAEWDGEGDLGNALLDSNVTLEELEEMIPGIFNPKTPIGQTIGYDNNKIWYNSTVNPLTQYDATVSNRRKVPHKFSETETRDCPSCGIKYLRHESHKCLTFGLDEDDQ